MVKKYTIDTPKTKVKAVGKETKTIKFIKTTIKNVTRDSSRKWLQRHVNDVYVHMAQADGYYSRAAYKIIEIQDKYNLFKNAATVLDLGCLPGSWMQVFLKQKIKPHKIYGVDINPDEKRISEVLGINFVQGDIKKPETTLALQEMLDKNQHKINLITSDIASNLCGSSSVDRLTNVGIFEAILPIINNFLEPQGNFVFKAISGSFNEIIQNYPLKDMFEKVHYFKPKSSRKQSSEMYIVCLGFKKS
jgi:23S rRNA (uridine2552-2'-O)-methyltransferase